MTTKIADQLRKRASALQSRIDAKLDPACVHQNLTPRRIRMANQMRTDGLLLQKHQSGLLALAKRHEAASGAPDLREWHLSGIRFASQVALVMNKYTKADGLDGDKLRKAGIENQTQLCAAHLRLRYLAKQIVTGGPSEKEMKITAAVEALVGQKIPGFFPTPTRISDKMMEIVEAHESFPKRILEPSAGKGDLAQAIRKSFPKADLVVGEINYALADILELEGFEVIRADFLQATADEEDELFDAIVQNPPFEKAQDIDHICHAYSWLEVGGILVSVMSVGPFFRNSNKSIEFREWLDELDHDKIDLDDKSFGKAFRPTGVSTKLVVIRK